jgi:hypothetical protein
MRKVGQEGCKKKGADKGRGRAYFDTSSSLLSTISKIIPGRATRNSGRREGKKTG